MKTYWNITSVRLHYVTFSVNYADILTLAV